MATSSSASPATLTWLDLTSGDRDKMRRVLNLFDEKDTLDEMGIGSLRDALANELFPGTSTLQTRLRYILFIPWLYRDLERRRVGSVEIKDRARSAEIKLIGVLRNNDDDMGVIGKYSGEALTQLPSNVFWNALRRWGIFTQDRNQTGTTAILIGL